MKKIMVLVFVLMILLTFSGCGNKPETDTGALPPMIEIAGQKYIAPNMPVEELPEEYHYLRDLTEKEANNTGLEDCAIYVNPQDEAMSTIYLYQECGTPIDENTVDPTQRQWAYVQWKKVKAE